MAEKVMITTEHGVGMPKELMGAIRLVVPAWINFINNATGETVYSKLEDQVTLADVLENFQKGYIFSTAAPSPNVIVDRINKIYEEVPTGETLPNNILHFASSSKATLLHNSAVIAAEEINEKSEETGLHMEVLDSQFASVGTGLVAMEAEKLAEQGKDIDEIVQILTKDFIPRLHVYTYIDSLYYPIIGGRVKDLAIELSKKPEFQKLIKTLNINVEDIVDKIRRFALEHKGAVDKVKGILKIENGEVKADEIKFDLFHVRPLKMLMERFEQIGEVEQVIIAHFNNEGMAKQLAFRIKEKIGKEPIITEMAPSIAAHHGPGGLGIAVVEKKKQKL